MSQKQNEWRALVSRELKKDRVNGMNNARDIWRGETRRNPDGGTLLKWGAIGGLAYLLVKHFSATPTIVSPPGQLGVTSDNQQGAVAPRTGGI